MPVYEYRCSHGHTYDKTEGFDAPTEHKCLTCGATARRQISVPAIIFKGSGFYSTDNRKSGGRNGASSSSSASTDGHSDSHSDSTTAEPKVEAAAE